MDRFEGRHHKNPHAHVIHKPGRRLMHHIPLKFVWNKAAGHGKRSPNAALNLVSFIDFLVTTVIFLLSSFSASGEITVDKNVRLPKAENVDDVIDAPMVAVNGNQILVDGQPTTSIDPQDASHTFAVPELGLIVALPGVADDAKNQCGFAPCPMTTAHRTVQFTFHTTTPGHFRWQCFVPCAAGWINGFGGPMQTIGYMDGFLNVKA